MDKKIILMSIAIYFCVTYNAIHTMEAVEIKYLNCFQDIYLLNTLTTGTSQESLAIRAAIESFKNSTEAFNNLQREQLKHIQRLAELSAITTTCLPD
jgi:hypothetical protein